MVAHKLERDQAVPISCVLAMHFWPRPMPECCRKSGRYEWSPSPGPNPPHRRREKSAGDGSTNTKPLVWRNSCELPYALQRSITPNGLAVAPLKARFRCLASGASKGAAVLGRGLGGCALVRTVILIMATDIWAMESAILTSNPASRSSTAPDLPWMATRA